MFKFLNVHNSYLGKYQIDDVQARSWCWGGIESHRGCRDF